jgi:hypothetical protein
VSGSFAKRFADTARVTVQLAARRGLGRAARTLFAASMLAACSDGGAPVELDTYAVAQLTVVGGSAQRIWSGRRSSDPFRVRALGSDGRPLGGVRVRFATEGPGSGVLSQPEAVTDGQGYAETFLMDTRSGDGTVVARSGEASARFAFHVDRAPGELRFSPVGEAAGLPGLPHPNELVSVQVIDSEGVPLPGTEVWFVGPERLSTFADTSDASGWTSTRVLQWEMKAGPGEVWAFVVGFPEVTAKTRRPVTAAAQRVLLVSIDGLRADAVQRYGPPTLARLAREGASTTTARTVTPALTTPAHLSLLSGVSPEKHGIWSDDLEFTPQMASLDPLFKSAGRAGLQARAFMSLQGPLARFEMALQCKLAFGLDSLTLVEPDANRVAGAALPTIRDPEVELVFLHVADPDLAGHQYGWSSAEYGQAVLRADSALARVVQEVDDRTLLMVVSDHGGGGAYGSHLHGSGSDEDMLIPIILWGSHVARAELGAASILDVPATALWALGLRAPSHYQGRVHQQAVR